MSEAYEIQLGIGLNDSDFESIKSKIKALEKDDIKIKLDTNTIDAQIKGIETKLKSLDNIKINLGTEIKIDGNVAIRSTQQIGQKIGTVISKSVKQSANIDDVVNKQVSDIMKKYEIAGDEGSDAFKKIKQALVECRTELEAIKHGNFDLDEQVFGNSAAVDKVTKAIADQMRAVNDLGDEYVALAEYMARFNDPKKGNKVRLPDAVKQEQGDDYRSNRGSLGIAFNTKEGISFVDFINDLNTELGQTISLTNGEADAMDELLRKLELGRKQRDALTKSDRYLNQTASTEEILQQNGVHREEIYADTMSIVSAIDSAEKQIAQSSVEATNIVVQNEERKQQEADETADKYESVAKKVQHSNKLISDSAQNAIDNVSSKSIGKSFSVDESDSLRFKQEMENLVSQWTNGRGELTDIKIGTTTEYDADTERYIEKITKAQVTYNNELGETIKKTIAWKQVGSKVEVIGENAFEIPVEGFVEVSSQYSKSLGKTKVQTDAFIKQQKQAVSNLANQAKLLHSSAIDQNASRPIKEIAHLDALESKYKEIENAIEAMGNASSETFAEQQIKVKNLISDYKIMKAEFKNAENVSSSLKGTDFASGLEIAKNNLEKFKAQARDFPQITSTIEELDKAIANVGDKSSLDSFTDQLKVARAELAKVKAETIATNRKEKVGIDVSGATSRIANIQRISPEIDEFKAKIDGAEVTVESLLNDLSKVNTAGDFSVVNKRLNAFEKAAESAGIAIKEVVTKAKSVDDIKLNIELGTYDNQISQMEDRFNRLSNASIELRESVEKVRNSYKEMNLAFDGTGDEVADRERLVQAEEDYARALEKTNNLLRIQAREEKANADAQKLLDNRELFQSKIDVWMEKNSAATKKFGADLLDLREKAKKADQVELNHLEKELQKIDKAADKAGLKMQSIPDKIRSKAKEYMAYFSVAEIFMETVQAMKRMFETVVEIDTAMTGLYRVTDLTASQYDALFDNMVSSAKEYGATLTDIINATTDWVRAGFEADKALGLAEVTTMYQHISDLDYDTAAENLITAYNGFKDELNTAFSGDEVAAVQYIADIFNELDKQNCPLVV